MAKDVFVIARRGEILWIARFTGYYLLTSTMQFIIIHFAKQNKFVCQDTSPIFSCQAVFACLTTEDGTGNLSRNVSKQLTTYAANISENQRPHLFSVTALVITTRCGWLTCCLMRDTRAGVGAHTHKHPHTRTRARALTSTSMHLPYILLPSTFIRHFSTLPYYKQADPSKLTRKIISYFHSIICFVFLSPSLLSPALLSHNHSPSCSYQLCAVSPIVLATGRLLYTVRPPYSAVKGPFYLF